MRKLSIYKIFFPQHTPFPFYQSSMYYFLPEYLLVNEKQDIKEPSLMANSTRTVLNKGHNAILY